MERISRGTLRLATSARRCACVPQPTRRALSSSASTSNLLHPVQSAVSRDFALDWKLQLDPPTPSERGPAEGQVHLTLPAPAGTSNFRRKQRLSLLVLRDASRHPLHVHPGTQQRLVRTSDLPEVNTLEAWSTRLNDAGQEELVLHWKEPWAHVQDQEAAKTTTYPLPWLEKWLKAKSPGSMEQSMSLPTAQTWDKASITPLATPIEYERYMGDDAVLHQVLEQLVRQGLVFLKGVPTDKKSGHETTLRAVVERIGSVRRTWYGDLWDVKAEENSKNIAYTNLDLGLHMDLTHFEHPPRYQFLHCLLNGQIEGGSSYFVDSYKVVELLRNMPTLPGHPGFYHTLTTSPVTFSYHNGGHHTIFHRPTVELAPHTQEQQVHAVNYSPPFQGALPPNYPAEQGKGLRATLQEFAKLCDDESLRYRVQLQPGDLVLFDNRRTLHARTAFDFLPEKEGTTKKEQEERGRWLKGAYMDGDEVWSKYRELSDALVSRTEAAGTQQ